MPGPLPPQPVMQEGDRTFVDWYVGKRNRKRRNRARAIEPEVISSACDGTTLVQVLLHASGRIEEVSTPDSPSCPV